jgi:hypothetical protein
MWKTEQQQPKALGHQIRVTSIVHKVYLLEKKEEIKDEYCVTV